MVPSQSFARISREVKLSKLFLTGEDKVKGNNHCHFARERAGARESLPGALEQGWSLNLELPLNLPASCLALMNSLFYSSHLTWVFLPLLTKDDSLKQKVKSQQMLTFSIPSFAFPIQLPKGSHCSAHILKRVDLMKRPHEGCWRPQSNRQSLFQQPMVLVNNVTAVCNWQTLTHMSSVS